MSGVFDSLSMFPNSLSVFFVGILGALFGSFANVWIYRYLIGLSVNEPPRSFCPQCGRQIRWFDNIPIISFVLLRGRCRQCGHPISWQYPVVEILVAVIWMAVFLKEGSLYGFVEFAVFFFLLVIMSFIDLRAYLLPDTLTLSGIVLGLVGAWWNPDRSLMDAIWGAGIGYGFFWLLSVLYYLLRGQMGLGGGDVKLLAMFGSFMGWQSLPSILLVSSVIGGLYGLWSMRFSQQGWKTMIPFGPFLALGAMITYFSDPFWVQAYLDFLLLKH